MTATVKVTNTGKRAGDEVVQLYTHQRTSRDKEPVRQLRAFQRVHLAAGESATVRLTFQTADLAHWDVTRDRNVVETSTYDVLVGASSADIRQRAALRVNGEIIPARDLAKPTRAVDFDDYQGVRLVDETKERGDAVGATGGDWLRFTDVSLGSRRGDLHRIDGECRRRFHRGPPRLADRSARGHRHGGRHRGRLQVRDHDRRAARREGPPRRLPGVPRRPATQHLLPEVGTP